MRQHLYYSWKCILCAILPPYYCYLFADEGGQESENEAEEEHEADSKEAGRELEEVEPEVELQEKRSEDARAGKENIAPAGGKSCLSLSLYYISGVEAKLQYSRLGFGAFIYLAFIFVTRYIF